MNAGSVGRSVGFARAVPPPQQIAENPDLSLAERARIVLLTTEGVALSDGVVEATRGVLTLRGQVRTSAERAKAGLAVGSIDGVEGVRNFLQLAEDPAKAAEPATAAIEPTDDVLKQRVEEALKSDKKLDGLTVGQVNHGVIHMSGKGVTLTGRLRAVELAWDVAEGVSESAGGGDPRSQEKHRSADKGETI